MKSLLCFVQDGASNGALLIKNAELKHAGRYTCTAQTPIDNATASAHLVVRGELTLQSFFVSFSSSVLKVPHWNISMTRLLTKVFWSGLDIPKH